jgi:hypothetical protein
MSEETTVKVIYVGQRYFDEKKYDTFEDGEREYNFHRKPKDAKHRLHLVIGHRFEIPHTDGKAFQIGSAEDLGQDSTDEQIEEWSMKSRAAHDEQQTAGSLKKVKAENDERWEQAIAPIRRAYQQASHTQRRAIKIRVLELLEQGY